MMVSIVHDRGVRDRLHVVSRRMSSVFHALQKRFGWHTRPFDARHSRAHFDDADAHRLRHVILHRKIVSAVRQGAIFQAMKYELMLDVDLVRDELAHEIDLLIDQADEGERASRDPTRVAH